MVRFHKAVDFYQQEVRPYFRNAPKKSFLSQAAELAWLAFEYRYPPYQYLKCGLYLASARGVDVRDYLPPHLIKKVQNRLNPAFVRHMANDKIVFRRILSERGLPAVCEILRSDREGRVFDSEDRPLTPEEGLARLRAHGDEVFVKPVDGTWGRNAGLFAPEDMTTEMLARPNLMVQPRVVQHPVLARLYPHAVNTVRIDTLLTEDGVVHNAAVLKLGVGGAVVDNGSAGGLLVGIDLETGALDAAGRQRPPFGAEEYRAHPDTGAPFAGVVLPHWDMVRATVTRAAEAMRPLGTLGWDVVITPEGVLLLEANAAWGVNILQTGRRGIGNTPVGRMARRLHGLPEARTGARKSATSALLAATDSPDRRL